MSLARRGVMLALAFALGVLGLAVSAQVASASYPRPKGATPVRVALVVAYQQCTAPNSTHGGPLPDNPSANPNSCTSPAPVQTSNYLTVGTLDANGADANSVGRVRLDVKTSSPEDIAMKVNITDVRCNSSNAVSGYCNNANTDNPNLPDYAGEVAAEIPLRITDNYNCSTPPSCNSGSFTDPATMEDVGPSNSVLGFPVNVSCASTASTTIGASCDANTTMNAVVPGSVQDGHRVNYEVPNAIQVYDGGSDGIVGTAADNTLFEEQGYFVPEGRRGASSARRGSHFTERRECVIFAADSKGEESWHYA